MVQRPASLRFSPVLFFACVAALCFGCDDDNTRLPDVMEVLDSWQTTPDPDGYLVEGPSDPGVLDLKEESALEVTDTGGEDEWSAIDLQEVFPDLVDVAPEAADSANGDGDDFPEAVDSLLEVPVDLWEAPQEVVSPQCMEDEDCDDQMNCTNNVCASGLCVTTPKMICAWPAEQTLFATNLTAIEGGLFDNDFHKDLSGAVWDPVSEMLWVCTNNGPSRVWALSPDGTQSFQVDYKDGNRGEWEEFGDLEGLTLADPAEPETLYLLIEGGGRIREYDLSTYGVAVLKNDWDAMAYLGGDGAEGITFVPDTFLQAEGFVSPAGEPVVSKNGMGGLMLVGHQAGGDIHAFDLNRDDGTFTYVGKYLTDRDETAALEFDRSTGLLFIWHGADHKLLEIAKLSSTETDTGHKMDSVKLFAGPNPILFGSTNYEGIAVMSNDDCFDGQRGFFLTIDGGGTHSLLWYRQFPCE